METAIRATRRATQAEEWALVLAAAGIPHRVEAAGGAWAVLVSAADSGRAHAALDAYDAETRGELDARIPAAASTRLAWVVGVSAGALLVAFFALIGPPTAGSRWFQQGAASARQIVSGEPWRAVTALTLHVDAVHVAGNAVATAVLLPAIVQRLGPGWGLWLPLLAGTAGNLLAATVYDPRHVAVGASTATFGAIGILAALRLSATPTRARRRWKPWIVPVACLVLLAFLGAGRDADVLTHGLGLLSGGALGFAAGAPLRRLLSPSLQWPLVAMAVLAVVGCWRLALAAPAS